jgi:hypothetical protein
MSAQERELVLVHDEDDNYYLDTSFVMKNKQPLFFGAVQIRKNYVSYHLMPVYVMPQLLNDMSPDLRKRMQGKSCFNFKTVDEALFVELAELTAAGLQIYKDADYV